MPDPARISIIIPAYNVEAYVEAAVESVLEQTVAAHEVIIINDGSTDGTGGILAGYAQHPGVQYLEQANQGVGATRNRGAALASGDYIYFFDSDDLLDKRFVESMQRLVVANAWPDLVMFSAESFTTDTTLAAYVKDFRRGVEAAGVTGMEALSLLGKNDAIAPFAWLYLARSDYWKKSKMTFPDTLYEDEDVLIALVVGAGSVVITDTVLFYRWLRSDSIVTSQKGLPNLAGRKNNVKTAVDTIGLVPAGYKDARQLLRRRCRRLAKQYVNILVELKQPADKVLLLRTVWRTRSMSLLRKIVLRLWLERMQIR